MLDAKLFLGSYPTAIVKQAKWPVEIAPPNGCRERKTAPVLEKRPSRKPAQQELRDELSNEIEPPPPKPSWIKFTWRDGKQITYSQAAGVAKNKTFWIVSSAP